MLNKIYSCLLMCSALLLFSCEKRTEDKVSIIPTPVHMEMGSGTFKFNKQVTIGVSDESLLTAVNYLQTVFNGTVEFSAETGNTKADIYFNLKNGDSKSGSYLLNVSSKQVVVEADSYEGIVSAIATIHQLLPTEIEKPTAGLDITIPAISIQDSPRLGWRGMMLDSSRHFWTKEEVKDVLDLMAMYKLNKFHWHLTDDQGWRIEIKKYPLLTEKGAWRKFNSQDRGCMSLAVKEENPDYNIPAEKTQIIDGDTIYGGFYTQEDIKDIVSYASQRGIDVIPEVDMPGHFLAAIEQYPEIACTGLIGWGSVFSSPICPGKDSTLEFCKDVYREVFELFPYQFVHMGGDEVEKDNWKKCADCQRRMKKEGLQSEEELQAWFVREMEKFFQENGKRFIGWDEVVEDGLTDKSAIMWWRGWNPKAIPTATAEGKNVINTHNVYLYFDYQQDEKTMGNLLGYDPISEELSDKQKDLVLGVQANVWTEWIPSVNRLQYMILPRLLALSEIAWNEPSKIKGLDDFYAAIVPHFKRMDVMGINYRIPDLTGFYAVNVFIDEAIVDVKCPLPNAEIRYTTDGTMPNIDSKKYEGPITITESTDFIFRTFRSNGTASDFFKTKYIKSPYLEPVDAQVEGEGLKAVWHEFRGDKCADIDKAKLNGEYRTDNVAIPNDVTGNIGLIFTGYLDIPEDGVYTFSLLSDDGSILKIHGDLVIDNDGPHAPKEILAQTALKKGLHPIEVRYFDSNGGILKMHRIDKDGNKEIVGKDWFKY